MPLSLLAALALAADGGAASAVFSWDVPEASAWVDVPGTLKVQGVPMKVKMTRSKWQAPRLLQHFATRFEEAGLYIAAPERQPQLLKEVQLTALDPESLHTFTVILQPNGEGTTLYLSEAAPASRDARAGSELPAFPGAQGKVSSNLEGAQSISYRVTAKQDEVEQFYAETLGRAGWRSAGGGHYVKDAREISLTLKTLGDTVRVLVWERAAAQR